MWNEATDSPRDSVTLMEKAGEFRSVTLNESARSLMQNYVTHERTFDCPWLFPRACRPMEFDYHVVRRVVHTLCDRANVRRLNPHKFRSYVLMQGVKKRIPFATMSKFLGHKRINTSYEFYFDVDLDQIAEELERPVVINPPRAQTEHRRRAAEDGWQ